MDNGEQPFHVVTNRDVWKELRNLSEAITGLTSELSGFMKERQDLESSVDSHGERIRSLEFKFYGVVAGLIPGYIYIAIALFKQGATSG